VDHVLHFSPWAGLHSTLYSASKPESYKQLQFYSFEEKRGTYRECIMSYKRVMIRLAGA
jgi:hypothetical protein